MRAISVSRLWVSNSRLVWRSMASAASAGEEELLVLVEDRGPVRLITINRPRARNAVNPATAKELYTKFTEFESESNARVAVLHGIGGTFCAGYDLKDLAAREPDSLPRDIDPAPPLVHFHPY